MNQEKIWDLEYEKNPSKWNKETLDIPKIKNKVVLEIGVGNGKTLRAILRNKPKSITAIDISQKAIELSQKEFKFPIEFRKQNIIDLKEKEKYEIIFCHYVLNNLLKKDRLNALKTIKTSLRPTGKLFIQDFLEGDFRQHSENSKKYQEKNTLIKKSGLICHFFTKEEIIKMLKVVGFKKIKYSKKEFKPFKNTDLIRKIFTIEAAN